MAKKVTTLFIRDTDINLLVMKGTQVAKWASLPLEPGLVSQGLVVDEEQVADRVKQIFKETKAKKDKVIIALSGHDSLYRIITMPELPEAVLPEAIRREAKRTIPTPLEEIYFSYQLLPASKGETRIFLTTFPRNLVDALIRTLHEAGVKPSIMDLAPLALCRIPNEPRAIIVNARLDHLDVAVIADRLPQVIRRVSLPTEGESLDEKLPFIAEEFNRTVAFYNSSHIEKPIDSSVPVFVTGDPAEEPETWQSLVGGAGYSVSALRSPVEIPGGFNPNDFMVNIGLALKELRVEEEGANFSVVNLNALPEAYVPPHFSIARVLVPIGLVIGIGLIIVAAILILSSRAEINTLSSEVAIRETSVAGLRSDIAVLQKQLTSVGATADELSHRLTTTARGAATMYDNLDQIVELASGKATLSSVSHKGGSVTVSGTASSVDDIFSYARSLRSGGRFSQVWISSIRSSRGSSTFQLSLTSK
ncbi:MAG: pilus assembly protein PilM [Dehalococcoidia bacterium]